MSMIGDEIVANIHPGEALREDCLKAEGLTATSAAKKLVWPARRWTACSTVGAEFRLIWPCVWRLLAGRTPISGCGTKPATIWRVHE